MEWFKKSNANRHDAFSLVVKPRKSNSKEVSEEEE